MPKAKYVVVPVMLDREHGRIYERSDKLIEEHEYHVAARERIISRLKEEFRLEGKHDLTYVKSKDIFLLAMPNGYGYAIFDAQTYMAGRVEGFVKNL